MSSEVTQENSDKLEKIRFNYNLFKSIINKFIPSRSEKLLEMYDSYGNRLIEAPASSYEHFHNAFIGGYIDHVNRVMMFSMEVYNLFVKLGIDVSGFSKENLIFSALNHDLGKLGLPEPNMERYVPNSSDWHKKNLGRIFETNDKLPFMPVQDMSLFILQYHNIQINMPEFIGILTHDGMYEERNKPYYLSSGKSTALRITLPHILHTADLLASKHEYFTWKKGGTNIEQKMFSSELTEEDIIKIA